MVKKNNEFSYEMGVLYWWKWVKKKFFIARVIDSWNGLHDSPCYVFHLVSNKSILQDYYLRIRHVNGSEQATATRKYKNRTSYKRFLITSQKRWLCESTQSSELLTTDVISEQSNAQKIINDQRRAHAQTQSQTNRFSFSVNRWQHV